MWVNTNIWAVSQGSAGTTCCTGAFPAEQDFFLKGQVPRQSFAGISGIPSDPIVRTMAPRPIPKLISKSSALQQRDRRVIRSPLLTGPSSFKIRPRGLSLSGSPCLLKFSWWESVRWPGSPLPLGSEMPWDAPLSSSLSCFITLSKRFFIQVDF